MGKGEGKDEHLATSLIKPLCIKKWNFLYIYDVNYLFSIYADFIHKLQGIRKAVQIEIPIHDALHSLPQLGFCFNIMNI